MKKLSRKVSYTSRIRRGKCWKLTTRDREREVVTKVRDRMQELLIATTEKTVLITTLIITDSVIIKTLTIVPDPTVQIEITELTPRL